MGVEQRYIGTAGSSAATFRPQGGSTTTTTTLAPHHMSSVPPVSYSSTYIPSPSGYPDVTYSTAPAPVYSSTSAPVYSSANFAQTTSVSGPDYASLYAATGVTGAQKSSAPTFAANPSGYVAFSNPSLSPAAPLSNSSFPNISGQIYGKYLEAGHGVTLGAPQVDQYQPTYPTFAGVPGGDQPKVPSQEDLAQYYYNFIVPSLAPIYAEPRIGGMSGPGPVVEPFNKAPSIVSRTAVMPRAPMSVSKPVPSQKKKGCGCC